MYSKQFFIEFHHFLYKYRKYGSEIISDANFKERIKYLQEAEDIRSGTNLSTQEGGEQLAKEAELRKKYEDILKGEQADVDKYV